jgi:4-carboxymuconolactone decarboxylase
MTKIIERIGPLPREEWTDDSREVCAFWGEPNAWEEGSKTSIIMTMANHPDLGKAYNVWGKHLLMGNTLSTRVLEIIVLRIAAKVKSAYEWHNHVGYGMNAGLTLDDIAAIRDWRPEAPADPRWTETEQAVLVGIEELIGQGTLSDGTWATLSKAYDKRQMMDLVFTIGHYVMTSWPHPGQDLEARRGRGMGGNARVLKHGFALEKKLVFRSDVEGRLRAMRSTCAHLAYG